MTDAVLVSDLSDTELDEVSGGYLQYSSNDALSLNVAVLNFGQTTQVTSTNQQSANNISLWGGVRQRIYSRTEAESEVD